MFFDTVYHNFVQNAAKVVLINITEIEFSHRYEFVWRFFSGRHRGSPEGTVMETESQLLGQCYRGLQWGVLLGLL